MPHVNKYGFPGVRHKADGRGKPYYARFAVDGRRYETIGCATAVEAFQAGKMLRRMVEKRHSFPPCTCGGCEVVK